MSIRRKCLWQLAGVMQGRRATQMQTRAIGQNLFLIDLQTCGFNNLIASYVVKGENISIVETGPTSSIPNLLLGLNELQINPEDVAYVALSHVHIDHGGGVGTLLRSLPNAKVIVHPKGAPHLKDPAKLWAASKHTLGEVAEMFGEPEAVPENRIIVASEGKTFDVGGGLNLRCVESSGHASHSLSFFEPLNDGIFTGDSAGAYLVEFDTVFPTTPPPFHPDLTLVSLDKFISLNPKVLYYSHFGKASKAVTRLLCYRAQIRLWLEIMDEGMRQGENPSVILERLLREDESISAAVPWLKASSMLRKTLIENSFQGFMEFARASKL